MARLIARRKKLGVTQVELVRRAGMTQQELADICKMPQPSIARIESGESSPNLSTLQKICDALDLKIKIEK